MPTGLRERKKQRTRAAIAEAALELFLERGFDETRIDDIAEAADVSPRTFFSYYSTKEEVVFSDLEADFEAMRSRLSARPAGESAVDALRAWIGERMAAPDFNDAEEIKRKRLIRSTPALAAYELAHVDPEFRSALAEAVADDVGRQSEDLVPRMVAAAASAALRTVADYYGDVEGADDPERLLDTATVFLDAGLAALSQAKTAEPQA